MAVKTLRVDAMGHGEKVSHGFRWMDVPMIHVHVNNVRYWTKMKL